jgi:hypothetical protein
MPNSSTPRIVPFIFNWKGQFEHACRTEAQLLELFDRVIVINSDDVQTRAGWIDIGDESYFAAQFFKALALFDGDILFHVQADATYDNWRGVVENARKYFEVHRWGVFAPHVDFTNWNPARADVGSGLLPNAHLRLVACTDCTCWFIHRDMLDQLMDRKTTLFFDNKYGMGIDITLSALSYLNGRPVIRDYSHTIAHPRSRGYNTDEARAELARFFERAPPDLRSILDLIWHDWQALAELVGPSPNK